MPARPRPLRGPVLRRRLQSGVGVGVGALAIVIIATVPAWAHAQLVRMSPENGSTVQVAPTQVVLTFDEAIQTIGDAIVVTGPDSARVDAGPPTIRGATATVTLRPLVLRGHYTVSYRIVSDDGHPVTATLGFAVTSGRPGTAAASPGTTIITVTPVTPVTPVTRAWWAALPVLAAAVAAAGLIIRRQTSDTNGTSKPPRPPRPPRRGR